MKVDVFGSPNDVHSIERIGARKTSTVEPVSMCCFVHDHRELPQAVAAEAVLCEMGLTDTLLSWAEYHCTDATERLTVPDRTTPYASCHAWAQIVD